MRIAILQNGFIRGGTERFVINLCKGLPKDKYDITVINPSLLPEQQVLEPEVTATGATIQHTTTIQGITGRLKHLYLLYKLLCKGQYDVFHTNLDLFNGPNLLVAWLARVPIRICHAHASQQHKAADQGETLPIKAYQYIMRWMCWTFANRHIGCSNEANNFLYRGHNWSTADYPTVLYNGIDLYTYSIRNNSCPSVLSLNLPKNFILSVGRFTTQKNPYFILEIMEKLNDIRPDIQLIWVGEGELFNDIKKKTTNANVSFLGWRDDMKELMQRSSLLLMPSLYEGLPLTLVEAQASGLPCLVSDTITQQAQCGLIEYKSLSESTINWCNSIIAIIEGNHTMSISPQTLEKFSIHTLASQMQSVINDNH